MHKSSLKRFLVRKIAMAAAMCLAMASGACADEPQEFTVGAVGSLTGPTASFDKAVVDGVEAAIQYWNDNGGYNGREVVLRLLDDESRPATAVTVYRRLTDDPDVRVVIAASPAQSLVAIKAVADEFGTPTAGSATLDALADPPAAYFFRTLPSSRAYMAAMMSWVANRGYETIAIMNPSDVTGQREAAVIQELAGEYGLEVVAAETYNNTDTNFTAQLVNIRRSNPDFFYAGVIGGPTVLVFRQIKQLNLEMPLALHSSAFNETFYTNIGGREAAEGVFTPVERGGLGSTLEGESGELYAAVSEILGHPATNLNTAGFDTGLVIMDAVNRSDGTREGIRAALESTNALTVVGGAVTYSAEDRRGKDESSIAVAQVIDGEFVETE